MKNCMFGENLVLLGAATAFQLARCNSLDNITLLAAFFTILGDNLAMIASARSVCDTSPANETENSTDTQIVSVL